MLSIIAGTTTRTQTVFGAEDPKMYHRQGLHPVHLGDTFVGRYTVVHKLGHGASSTIWLVEDTKTCSYASLKIISAAQSASQSCVELVVLRHLQDTFSEKEEGSRHVARMLDHFMHDGPNGRHQCIVEEALGPSLASYVGFVWDEEVIPADIVRQLVGQIALGVEYLHKRNVVHGDLHQGNILLCPPTPMATLADVESHMGKPRKWLVTDTDSGQIPRYLVSHPTDPEFLRLCFTRPQAKLCDFSEAWIPGLSRPRDIATPNTYRPPKALLGIACRASADTDLWALAVLIHLLFTGGCGLFYGEDGNRDRLLSQMVLALGRFPEPLWSSWADRNKYFNEQGQPLDPRASSDFLKAPWVFNQEMPEGGHERRMFENLLRTMVSYYPCATATSVVASEWIQNYCRPHMRRL